MYLQKAGKNDEGWQYLGKALDRAIRLNSKDIAPMAVSQVYEKQRVFLQRENKHGDALFWEIFSFLSWQQGLIRQKRKDEFNNRQDRNFIENYFEKLLKKAGKENIKEKLIDFIIEKSNSLNGNVSVAILSNEVNALIFGK